jgi:cytochrome c553
MLLAISVTSCYYDNEEELYPDTGGCDTANVTYSASISPIMQSRCNGCHDASTASGGVVTSDYAGLKTVADNGRLWGAVNHDDGYSPMPKNAGKLSDCDLSKIKAWIGAGAPNN